MVPARLHKKLNKNEVNVVDCGVVTLCLLCFYSIIIIMLSDLEEMVMLLLEYKARPSQLAGMCYPEPHIPTYSTHSKFFFVSPSEVCGGCVKDSYQRAIDTDNRYLLNILLEAKSSSNLVMVTRHARVHACATQVMLHHATSRSNVLLNKFKHLADFSENVTEMSLLSVTYTYTNSVIHRQDS